MVFDQAELDPVNIIDDAGTLDSAKDFVAGGVGGISQLIVGHPLDTVKVKLQTGGTQYSGLGDACKSILRNEGAKGFYKGVASPLIGFTALNAILFSAYGMGTKLLRGDKDGNLPYHKVFLAGAFGGSQSSLVESPMDLFKAKMQSQKPQANGKVEYKSTLDCVIKVVRQNGLRGVYQGLPATWIRNIPGNGFYFLGYEWVKRMRTAEGEDASATTLLLAGGFAGLSFWAICFPLDSVKTLIQTDANTVANRKYKGYMDCAKRMYASGGIKRFYVGFAPGVLRSFPANAVCFFAYEFTKKTLG